jgi:hypothetical protein
MLLSLGLIESLEKPGGLNLYTYQAEAFLHSRLTVDAPDDMVDLAVFEDQEYVPLRLFRLS